RRLYDTSERRYVTLVELATKVRGGADLRVIDAQSSEDLTQATLTQIVLETGNAARFLPVQLLTQMIRLSDDALAEFFSRYVTGALDLYLQAKRGVQQFTTYNPLDALARMWMGPLAPTYQQYPGYAGPPPPQPPSFEVGDDTDVNVGRKRADTEPTVDARDDVAAMRRELDELKQQLLGKRKRKKS